MAPTAAAPASPNTPLPAPRCLLFAIWGTLGVLLWTAACAAPLVSWNAPRLASAYALAAGQTIYPAIDSGAQLGWFYGPGLPVWHLPVTLLRTPSLAMTVASLQNGLALLAAVAFALQAGGLRGGRLALGTGLAGALLFASGAAPQSWLLYLHVDAPCLVFALVAGAAAWRHEHSNRLVWLVLSAAAAAAACLTKQTSAMLPVAIVIGWLFRRQAGRAARWGAVFALCLAAGVAATAARYGADNLLFNTVIVHQLNPLKPEAVTAAFWVRLAAILAVDLLPWLAWLALLRVARVDPDPLGAKVLPPSPVGWYVWLAVAQLPLGIFAAGKAGGGLNSAHGLIFLLAALVLATIRTPPKPRILTAASLVLCAVALYGASDRLRYWRPSPYQDRLLELAKAHPHELFLPWNPLVTLLTDGRIYPFEDALYCRQLINLPVPADRVRAVLPERVMLVYDPLAASRDAARYYPGLTRAPTPPLDPETGDWLQP